MCIYITYTVYIYNLLWYHELPRHKLPTIADTCVSPLTIHVYITCTVHVCHQVAAQHAETQNALLKKISELEMASKSTPAPPQESEMQEKLAQALDKVAILEKMMDNKNKKPEKPPPPEPSEDVDDESETEQEEGKDDDHIVTMNGKKVLGMNHHVF